nr:hypothetical protein [Tanacetum cinerariifolium]
MERAATTASSFEAERDSEQIQALVDKQKVIIMEESIRRDLQFDDAEGTACLPNDTIFEELARMGKQVESSEEKDSLGAQKDASKQERSIKDIDQDAEIALVDESQGRMHDADMFGFDDLEGDETLIAIKAAKPKVISTADTTTPRAKGIVFHEQVQAHKPNVSSSKDKGKAKMIEYEKPLKKKDQIALNEEVERKLEAEIRAEMEQEERIAREKDEANKDAIKE